MAYYRHTYMPGFTTNDTYGNFYDGKKASLITVPDRLKNYDMDLRATQTATSGAEYGDFMNQQHQYQEQSPQPQWPLKPYVGAYSQREPMEGLDRHARPPPPPPMPPGHGARALPPLPLPDPEPLPSSREPPPPVSIERYRNPDRTGREYPEEAEARRHPRSRSPPPPPDLGTYRSHMEVYTGRGQAPPAPGRQGPTLSPPLAPPPPPVAPLQATSGSQQGQLLPALKYGAKEIHLPDIEAVELHMRDKSKVILNVREFYSRYLRD